MSGPLAGVRVIELAQVIQGPVAGRALADLGAEVIKIEPPAGDLMRFWHTQFNIDAFLPNGMSLAFNLVNRNKRSLVLDLHTPSGIAVLHRLVKESQVFITNMHEDSLPGFQADFASLAQVNPSLVYAQGFGLGPKGEYARMPTYDLVGMSHSGALFNASPDGEQPYYVVGAIGDVMAGTLLAMGVLAALQRRDRCEAQHVTCSQLQGLLWLQMMNVGVAANLGVSFPPFDRRTRYNPLVNIYRAADGRWFNINIPRPDDEWPRVCVAIGRPELLADPRFETLQSRSEHREALTQILEETFATRTRAEWVEIFRELDLWLGPVNRSEDLPSDPQVLANGYLSTTADGVVGPTSMFSIADHDLEPQPAPALGEDGEDVLRDVLRLSDEELTGLRAEGTLG